MIAAVTRGQPGPWTGWCRPTNAESSGVDITLIYGLITAATAISSGFAGARVAYLNRQAGSSEVPIDRSALTQVGADLSLMRRGVREAISERCSGAQNAAAWLATSTALLGVATTRPASDVISIVFVLIGAALVVVAIRAMLRAGNAAKLPPARAAFEKWYLAWAPSVAGSNKPTEEEVAAAFAEESAAYASSLRRFCVWPFPPMHIGRTRPPSEFLPNWG